MKKFYIYPVWIPVMLLLLALNSCSKKDNPAGPGDGDGSIPVISSLSDSSAFPVSQLVISGSGFGAAENLSVRFSGRNNYRIDVPVLEAGATSLAVTVPPFIVSANGHFGADTVNVRIIKKSGSTDIESNVIENFYIGRLSFPGTAPGIVTLNFLNWEISNYNEILQEIQGTSMDTPSITDAINENINNLQSLASNIDAVIQSPSSVFQLGSIDGHNIEIGMGELLQCDSYILAVFAALCESPSSLLGNADANNILSKLSVLPCRSEAFDQIAALQGAEGYTANSHYDCVASAAPDAVATSYKVIAGAGAVALGILALSGAPAIALALPTAAIVYAAIMTSGMQITIGASLNNINNSAAVTAIKNGVSQAEETCLGLLTGQILPGAAGAVKDIYDGFKTLGEAFNPGASTCSYFLSEYSKPFISTGGTGSISVTAGIGCEWSAISGASWITVITGITGSGNGTITYSVKPNSSSQQRTGSINVEDKSFTITQAGSGSQSGSFDGDWEGTFNGVHTYTSGNTYEYVDETLTLSISGTVITGGSPSLGTGTIDALGNGTWTGQYTPFVFTGTFSSDGTASGTWEYTIPGTGPQSGTATGTWTATKKQP